MIKKFTVDQNISTVDGEFAAISFAISAKDVPLKDAHEAESEFSKFLGRITGNSVTMTQSTTRSLSWTEAELTSIRPATSISDARRRYRDAFPKSPRSRTAVKTKYMELRREAVETDISAGGLPAAAPAEIPPAPIAAALKEKFNPSTASERKPAAKKKTGQKSKAKREAAIKNAEAPRWSDEEKEVVGKAPDAGAAWIAYKGKFPGKRTENAISQRRHKIHNTPPAKEAPKPRVKKPKLPLRMRNMEPKDPPLDESPVKEFTEAEDAAIRVCPSEEMALMRYQDKFPNSTRTAVEVSLRWQFLSGAATEEMAGETA